jgi:hypothetical protein
MLYNGIDSVVGNSRHSDRNIRGTRTIVCHRQTWVAQFQRGDFSNFFPGRIMDLSAPRVLIAFPVQQLFHERA